MNPIVIFIKAMIGYLLCIYYNVKFLLGISYLFLTKDKKEFWIPKSRPVPPKCLLDKEHGEHKFITLNVSQLKPKKP